MARTRRFIDGHLVVTDEATSNRLSRFGHQATRPEHLVRRFLHAGGLRFRTVNCDLPGSPDLANRRRKWAVFVHGCYWHHHAGCPRATIPTRNRAFWLSKFRANRKRDARAIRELEQAGFIVAVVWECSTGEENLLQRSLAPLLRLGRPAGT